MFCQKCGTQLKDGAAFCSGCGSPQGSSGAPVQQNTAMRTVTVKREGIFGTEPMSVFVDDGEYAIVRLGETKSFQVQDGTHRLQIRASTHAIGKGGMTVGQGNKNSYSSDVIFIQEADGNMDFSVKMTMTGKIQLTRTR